MHLPRRSRTQAFVKPQEILNPSREWFIILFLAILVLVMGCLYGFYVFYEGMHTVTIGTETNTNVQAVYDSTQVSQVLHMYQEKARHFKSLRENTVSIVATSSALETPVREQEQGGSPAVASSTHELQKQGTLVAPAPSNVRPVAQ